jgi:nucleolar protein 16
MGVRAKLTKKKGIKKVSRRSKVKKNEKAKEPAELLNLHPDVKTKMGIDIEWDKEDTLWENYERNGLALDLNQKFGRSALRATLGAQAATVAHTKGLDQVDWMDDDDLRVLRGESRKTGKAAPKRLTSTQIELVEALLKQHADDVDAMVRDIKINTYQHSAGQLKRLLASYAYWGGDWEATGVDFRAPKKSKGGKMRRA